MERISALIEKLRDQFAEGADIDQLLLTAQLLEGELRYHKQKGTVPASPHVAVLMPNNHYRSQNHYNGNGVNGSETKASPTPAASAPAAPAPVASAPASTPAAAPAQAPAPVIEVAATAGPALAPAQAPASPKVEDPEHQRYQPQPAEAQMHSQPAAPAQQQATAPAAPAQQQPTVGSSYQAQPVATQMVNQPAREVYNPLQEVPTLAQQIAQEVRKDVNEVMGSTNGRSLNETLKVQHKEVSTLLTETPIRDLKRAIGINDRYLFISELFRGEEIMYERSIKTINNFSIYQEAYYWMERELKLKLAWDMEKYSSQLFYQLVKRRFS